MEPTEPLILTHHPLTHIKELRVDPALFAVRFGKGCSMTRCSSTCCKGGVWADILERDNILQHVDIVHRYMDPEQEHDPSKWFETEIIEDADYPSGNAVGTEVVGKGCVFLERNGLCVLQKAEMGEKNPQLRLKPFYCHAFPIAFEDGLLVYDDYMLDTQKQCCSAVPDGELTIFDVCGWELEYMLGKEGVEELKKMERK